MEQDAEAGQTVAWKRMVTGTNTGGLKIGTNTGGLFSKTGRLVFPIIFPIVLYIPPRY